MSRKKSESRKDENKKKSELNERQKFGKLGEDLATQYLENNGYEIVERNFSCQQGEIDIIAKEKNEIVFVEVKTRKCLTYGTPAEAVTKEKRRHIEKTAQYYLFTKQLEKQPVRFDVIEVYVYGNRYRINHIKQIM